METYWSIPTQIFTVLARLSGRFGCARTRPPTIPADPEPDRIVWIQDEHRDWGDNISQDAKIGDGRYRYSGHTTPRVAVGDIIRVRTNSGAVADLKVLMTQYFHDPDDQWFAEVVRIS